MVADSRFEKWQAEKMKRKEKSLPAIVDYRDETYVSEHFQERPHLMFQW
jgi:hypothetical protein